MARARRARRSTSRSPSPISWVSRCRSGIDVYHRISDETSSNVYGTTATGGQLRFGLPVTRDVTASLFTGLDQTVSADANGPELGRSSANGDVFNKAWVGYTLTYNTLDDKKHPTEGLYATLTQQYVGWDYNFLKTEAKARYFMPCSRMPALSAASKARPA